MSASTKSFKKGLSTRGGAATGRLTATAARDTIVIARSDGSGKHTLGGGFSSFVSPDGSRVAVIYNDVVNKYNGAPKWRLRLLSVASGRPIPVRGAKCHPAVYWSPDSTKLACVTFTDRYEPVGLLLIDAASGKATTLVTGLVDGQVSFSPDSTRLAYVQRATANSKSGQLRLIDLATHAITTVRSGALATPVWGPSAIAFSTVGHVAVVQPDGSGFRQLAYLRPTYLQGGLVPVAWSADGRRLLGGQGGQDTWVAYAIDPIRGGARLIKPRVTPSGLTQDGRFVIGDTTEGQDFGPDGANVVGVPWARGGSPRLLLYNAVRPSLSGNLPQPTTSPGPSAASGRCSKATAVRLANRLRLGNAGFTRTPVAQVLCGAFVGPRSHAMVFSLTIPSCGRTGGWVVFAWSGGAWQLVIERNNGADLAAVGSDIRETMFVLRPSDSHCFPTGGTRSRVWHWDGTSFTVSAWKHSKPPTGPAKATAASFISPSRNLSCEMSRSSVYCQSVNLPHSVRMGLDGRLAICRGAQCVGNPAENTRTLGYGGQITVGRFRCLSRQSGITCTVIQSGKGFLIDRDGVSRVGP